MRKNIFGLGVALILVLSLLFTACQAEPEIIEKEVVVEKPIVQTVEVEKQVLVEKEVLATVVVEKEVLVSVTATPEPAFHAKYIFLFIGDGMGVAQRNAAELFLAATAGANARPEETKLVMNTFPVQGMNTTYDLTSVIPDSASTGTALSTGYKTKSGVVGMDASGTNVYKSIAEMAKEHGMKVGVISSVSIDHATPAAFYAHQPSRGNYYEISMELANSDFDYFAGGPPKRPTGNDGEQPDAIAAAKDNGFTIVNTRKDFEKLEPGVGSVWAMSPYPADGNALYYELDRPADDISLVEYVAKGIELLDNPDGFFMIVEGGKIDWACHANDAGAAIHDTLVFDQAIREAIEFYEQHPDETLIVVTGDHETGGMTIGFAGTKYSAFFDKIERQTMSYVAFSELLNEYKETHTAADAKFEDVMPWIEEAFGLKVLPSEEREALQARADEGDEEAARELGLVLTDLELAVLQEAFISSMLGEEERSQDDYTYLLYGGYEPLAVKLTTILNQKAGISWTSYSHTGIPVQTSALGVGQEMFSGYYDQTDVNHSMVTVAGF